MEEYINSYYGGTLGIAKRYGIEKGDLDFTTVGHGSGDTYMIILELIKSYVRYE